MTPMKRKRHTTEEVIRKLRTAEETVAGGRTFEEACRIMAVSMATCHALDMAMRKKVAERKWQANR